MKQSKIIDFKGENMGEHSGHRKRIIEKLNGEDLLDHELLEILLFNAMPRRNTNDLAHRLLAEFGSIENVVNAEFETLRSVEGVGDGIAAYLCTLGKINGQCQKRRSNALYGKMGKEKFAAFVKEKYAKERVEVIDAYFLDEKSNVIGEFRLAEGSLRNASFAPQELAKLLTLYQPTGLVLAHNHPEGKAEYSKEDEMMTRKVQVICSAQNVLFCEHLICGQDGVYSYYLSGKMSNITKEFSMYALINRECE